jgi:biotin carboxylase
VTSVEPIPAEPRGHLTVGRLLLLIPARTYRATDFLGAASKLGLDLVIGSDGALPLSAHKVVHVDPDDLPGSVDRLTAHAGPIHAVVAVDSPMLLLAAAVAARLGLPHNAVDAVVAAMDKAKQRRLWAAAGVTQPAFRVISSGAGEGDVKRAADEVGFPCVVKAVSLSGSRGVLRADDAADTIASAARIREVLTEAGRPNDEPLLIEEYVPGWEVSIDGLLTDGAFEDIAVFDKPDTPAGPTFEETVLVTPSRLPERILDAALSTAGRAADALGLTWGPIHAELRIDDRRDAATPAMIELGARSIGGLCSRALRFLDGVSLEEMVVANALGRRVNPPLVDRPSGVLMLPVERDGVLQSVEGRAEAAAVPGITGLSITVPMGQAVNPLPKGDRYLGFIFAEAESPGEVEEALRAARRLLRVAIR